MVVIGVVQIISAVVTILVMLRSPAPSIDVKVMLPAGDHFPAFVERPLKSAMTTPASKPRRGTASGVR